MSRARVLGAMVFVWTALAGAGCAGGAVEPAAGATEALVESAPLPDEVSAALADGAGASAEALDRVHVLEHDVRIGLDRHVHVTERFTLRAWLEGPRRGALLLPGTVVRGSFYELDVDGYRFASELASHGLFTFAIDAEGSGDSSYPEDGLSVTHAFLVEEARAVLEAVGRMRGISRMDVIGESNGGAVAAELCADATRVRSCVMASMLYEEGTPFFQAVFLDPGFLAYLTSQPSGYIDATPALYFNIASRTSPDVTAAILASQPGLYAVAPLVVPTTLPWFDPSLASVPGLVVQGTEDNIATQADADALAEAYGSVGGGEATVVRIAGAGHIPRIEPAPMADEYRDAVVEFLDPPW